MRGVVKGVVVTVFGAWRAGAVTGCANPYVTVDSRLAGDTQLWRKLDGPRYTVTADDPGLQAALAFEDAAALWEQVLTRERPEMRRMPDPRQADLVFTLNFNVTDLGVGVSTYPTYGWRGYGGGCGVGYGRRMHPVGGYEVVGTEVDAYHRGYLHTLFLSAWVADPSQPAGRRVIWEGQADRTRDEADLKAAMPYLTSTLGKFYGQATSKPITVKVKKDELPAAGPAASSLPPTSHPS